MPSRVTMVDVAREAGVSIATVSRAIGNKDAISPETRKQILVVADRLGYRPSSIARSMVTQQTGTLGLVVPDVSNPFFSDIARGAEDAACCDGGYNVFLCNTAEDLEREVMQLQSLEDKRVDGLILCSSRLEKDKLRELISRHPATVLVNRWVEADNTSAVIVDNEAGARKLTDHLLKAGHRSIGMLQGSMYSRGGLLRSKGYSESLSAADLSANERWMRYCPPTIEGGLRAAEALLGDVPELTAIFCYNDLVAIGVLQACRRLGRRVPDDLAVTGFDGIPISALVSPSLTTCSIDCYQLGSQVMQLLIEHIQGERPSERILLDPELTVRASAPSVVRET